MPQRINIQIQFIKITCGAGHSLALSIVGQVYSWGLNLLGQLGHDDTDTRVSPTLMKAFKEVTIVDVQAGAGHSFAIDKNNVAFSWGASADFQTGIYVKPSLVPG